ncbi:hypothetical protein PROFUN_10710 [Planoprotostelium fungivorum]|uniref:Uncharacterized protein n=1 Tax=Planoprotostelium fungivorum TaxID=1890364 RepID=A0A2P6N9N4_9EUKA|nr:hypothetical protein PROFUN_10710 [Planoprotostelium fungivorum]
MCCRGAIAPRDLSDTQKRQGDLDPDDRAESRREFKQFEAPANHFLLDTQSSNHKAIQPQQRWNILSKISFEITTNSFNTSDQEHMGLRPLWHLIGIPSEADLLTAPTDRDKILQWTDLTG